jgi:hypothetical protein
MAHYAFLDENNIVTEVIVGINETETIEGLDPETWYANFRNQKCKRTSYNNNIRQRFAGIGYTYDPVKDCFISPSPYPSWVLNEVTCEWEPPIPEPTVEPAIGKKYYWDESTLSWSELEKPEAVE